MSHEREGMREETGEKGRKKYLVEIDRRASLRPRVVAEENVVLLVGEGDNSRALSLGHGEEMLEDRCNALAWEESEQEKGDRSDGPRGVVKRSKMRWGFWRDMGSTPSRMSCLMTTLERVK